MNYEAEVTWNEATSLSKRDNIGNLIVAVFALIGIILLISLIFGVFFGGIRILMKRFFPNGVRPPGGGGDHPVAPGRAATPNK